MLRITIHDQSGTLTFQVEGTLAGPWVREAEESWQRIKGSPHKHHRFDLTGVTLIDAAGKALLAAAHAQGVEFIACGCLMRAVVAEITHAPLPDCVSTEQREEDNKTQSRRNGHARPQSQGW